MHKFWYLSFRLIPISYLYDPQHEISSNVVCATCKGSDKQSDQSLCLLLENSVTVELLNEHHLDFLSLSGGCIGSSESTHVKMPHCWKSHVAAQMLEIQFCIPSIYIGSSVKTVTKCVTNMTANRS